MMMPLMRAFCQWQARRLLNAAQHWLAPEGGMTMQRFGQWRAQRLLNAVDRWLLRSQQTRTLAP
jgi:hypothetical protein